jgi:hypothetical protein
VRKNEQAAEEAEIVESRHVAKNGQRRDKAVQKT